MILCSFPGCNQEEGFYVGSLKFSGWFHSIWLHNEGTQAAGTRRDTQTPICGAGMVYSSFVCLFGMFSVLHGLILTWMFPGTCVVVMNTITQRNTSSFKWYQSLQAHIEACTITSGSTVLEHVFAPFMCGLNMFKSVLTC